MLYWWRIQQHTLDFWSVCWKVDLIDLLKKVINSAVELTGILPCRLSIHSENAWGISSCLLAIFLFVLFHLHRCYLVLILASFLFSTQIRHRLNKTHPLIKLLIEKMMNEILFFILIDQYSCLINGYHSVTVSMKRASKRSATN